MTGVLLLLHATKRYCPKHLLPRTEHARRRDRLSVESSRAKWYLPREYQDSEGNTFEVLIASIETDDINRCFDLPGDKGTLKLIRGDHSIELSKICAEMSEATKYVANDSQKEFLEAYIESFRTGSLDKYRDAQGIWVVDTRHHEWRTSLDSSIHIGIHMVHERSSRVLWPLRMTKRPKHSPDSSRTRPRSSAVCPGQPRKTTARDRSRNRFSSLRILQAFIVRAPMSMWFQTRSLLTCCFEIIALAYCSSIIFPGINLPNVRLARLLITTQISS
jgi:hypothetical protein